MAKQAIRYSIRLYKLHKTLLVGCQPGSEGLAGLGQLGQRLAVGSDIGQYVVGHGDTSVLGAILTARSSGTTGAEIPQLGPKGGGMAGVGFQPGLQILRAPENQAGHRLGPPVRPGAGPDSRGLSLGPEAAAAALVPPLAHRSRERCGH